MHNNALFKQLTKPQQMYVESIREIGADWGYDLTKSNWTRKELVAISMKRQGNDDVPNWIVKDNARRVGRGVYAIPELPQDLVRSMDTRTVVHREGEDPIDVFPVESVSPGHGHEGDELADTAPVHDDPTDNYDDEGEVAVEYSAEQHTMIRK